MIDDNANESKDSSDVALLTSWASGDKQAASVLIRRHFATLHRFLRTRAANETDLEDLVQQTLLACIEARDRYRQEGSFKVFLLGIARHKLYSYYRERQRWPRTRPGVSSLGDGRTSPSLRLVREEEGRRVDEAFQSLSLEAQIVLELAYREDLAGPELAEALGVPLNTAYSRLRRARRALAVAFGRREAEAANGSSTSDLRSEHQVERIVASWRSGDAFTASRETHCSSR